MENRTARTLNSVYELEPTGIVLGTVLGINAVHQLEDAKESLEAIERLAQGEKVYLLLDLRKLRRGITREARQHYSGPEAERLLVALAMVVGSPLTRLVGNLFIGLNRPREPTRLFTSEAEARTWLLGQSR